MRVLVATDQWFPDVRGGVARLATETSERLAARGHDVTVVAPVSRDLPRDEKRGNRRLLRVVPRNALPRTLLDTPATWQAVRRRGGFDVVVGHNPAASVGAAAALPRTPLVHVFHASPPREARLARRAASPARKLVMFPLEPILVQLEQRALRRAAEVFVLSRYSETLVDAREPAAATRTRLMPVGIDDEVFHPGDGREAARGRLGIAGDARLIVAVRRLDAALGLEELIDAVSLLEQDVQLVIVGSGPLEASLRARAAQLDRSILFPGAADDTALADWYRAADLFVLPPAPHEGLGLATIEALACGTAAAGVASGATAELLGALDRRVVAPSAEPTQFAAAIEEALTLGASRAFRDCCRAYAATHFSWPRAIEAWERALIAVAHTGGPRQEGISTLGCDEVPARGARATTPNRSYRENP